MTAELDLDDVAAQSKKAAAELAELRVELERLRSDCAEMTAKHSALEDSYLKQGNAAAEMISHRDRIIKSLRLLAERS